jgi:TolA-binding protein
VPEGVRAEAAAMFRALESARESGYTTAVEAIDQALEDWGFPSRAQTSEARGVESLRKAIRELETAIQHLRGSHAYQVLETTESVGAAIEAWTRDLRQRLRRLTETSGQQDVQSRRAR